jgi:hypothetical protein
VLSQYRQAAWGTAIAAADMTRIQRFDGSAVLDLGTERRSDRGMSGKGFSFATNSQHTMLSSKFSGIKAELTDWLAGFVLGNLMGSVVTTGAASPYSHLITFDETTRSAIPTTVYLKDTADVAYMLIDMFCTSATLTIPAKGSVGIEWDMLGTGIKTLGVLGTAPTVPNETYIMGSDAVASFGPVGAPVTFLGRFMNATIKVDNQGVVHEAPGGGLYGIFGRRSDPKFSLQMTIAAKEVDDIFTHYVADDKVTFALPILTSANCAITLNIPSCNLKTTKLGFDGDMPIWNLETDETTSYQNGGVPPISFTVASTQPTFMTVAP